MNSLKIHSKMKYEHRNVELEMYHINRSIRYHFSTRHDHIPGFFLFIINNDGITFDKGVSHFMGDVPLDLDRMRGDMLKIIGVDII